MPSFGQLGSAAGSREPDRLAEIHQFSRRAWLSSALSLPGPALSIPPVGAADRAPSSCRGASRAAACGNCAGGRRRCPRAPRIRAPARAGNRGTGIARPAFRCRRTWQRAPLHRESGRSVRKPGVSITQAPPGRRWSDLDCRRVLAAAVVRAHGAGVLHCGAEQRIGQRRFARPRGAKQHQRLPAPEIAVQCPCAAEASIAFTANTSTLGGTRPSSSAKRSSRTSGVGVATSALVSTTTGTIAVAVDERQIALEPPRIEVVIEAHQQQRGIDVADDGMDAPVAVAPRDMRRRRHARLDPRFSVARRTWRAPSRRRRARSLLRVSARASRGSGRAPRSARPSCTPSVLR